jgi:hypothetical protein
MEYVGSPSTGVIGFRDFSVILLGKTVLFEGESKGLGKCFGKEKHRSLLAAARCFDPFDDLDLLLAPLRDVPADAISSSPCSAEFAAFT